MRDGAFELSGLEFGTLAHDVVILTGGFDPGDPKFRVADADAPGADGIVFGRDYISGPEIAFTVGVRNLPGGDVWGIVSRLARVWRADDVRFTPGATLPLRFARAGRVYAIPGRPRRFAVKPSDVYTDEWTEIDLTFQAAGPWMFAESATGEDQEVTIHLLEVSSDGGLVLPADVPFDLDNWSTQARQGEVVIGGAGQTPFTATIYGPVTGALSRPVIYGSGWRIGLTCDLGYADVVQIDTAAMSVTRNGVPCPGLLTPSSRLSVRLSPGPQTVGFDGVDPSNTAYVRLAWRDAYPLA